MTPPDTTVAPIPAPPGASPARARRAIEMPTILLLAGTYAGWLGTTSEYGHWSLWIVAPLTALCITLHSSLQHEIVHGHPTRWFALNRWLGIVPLSLWLPYDRYRAL